MNFSPAQALSICTATLRKRAENRKSGVTYMLHYCRTVQDAQQNKVAGTIIGSTIAELYRQFAASYSHNAVAFITKKNDHKILRFYNEAQRSRKNTKISNGWSSMTKGKKKS